MDQGLKQHRKYTKGIEQLEWKLRRCIGSPYILTILTSSRMLPPNTTAMQGIPSNAFLDVVAKSQDIFKALVAFATVAVSHPFSLVR